MIYFALAQHSGFVKVGHTAAEDPSARLATLQTGSPHTLALLHSEPGDRAAERELHRRFTASRERGEWFRLDGELLGHLARVMTFAEFASLDARLTHLEKRITGQAAVLARKKRRCANDAWFGYTTPASAWDPHLDSLVGWHRTVQHSDDAVHPLLASSGAYDTVFERLYGLLPNCRGCGCLDEREVEHSALRRRRAAK